jgi:2,4-dienoyl-CoA reductase-like NADH-dependent reductase (Old Yellow Enzyme family)
MALFTRQRLNGMWLKNRFVRSPTYEALATTSGLVTPGLTKLYSDLGDGQIGLLLTSCTLTDPRGRHHPMMLSILSDAARTSLGHLASDVHRHGACFGVQLVHAGTQAKPEYLGRLPVEGPDSMSRADIDRAIQNFISGAQLAFSNGADVVELHSNGGYLLASFLSPKSNHRTDEFGGTQAARTEVHRRIIAGIRKAVLPTHPILVKLNGFAGGPTGLSVPEAVEVAKLCEAAGADGIEVFAGMPPGGKKVNRAHTSAIRKAVKAVIIASGGFVELKDMEDAVAVQKYCDMVSLSRPVIRQPDLVKLFREGKVTRADCIGCNGCSKATSIKENPLRCVLKK